MGTCEVQNEIKMKQNQMKRKPIEMNQYKQCVCVCVIERERGDYMFQCILSFHFYNNILIDRKNIVVEMSL